MGSALLAGAVALIVAGNLPIGEVSRFLHFLTVDQAWDVFAPDPVSAQAELEAVVDFADGREEIWRPPRTKGVVALASYHWDMWTRVAMLGYPPVADATARWVAARFRGGGAPPVRVTLRRSWYRIPPPGSKQPRLWHETDVWVRDFQR